MKYEILQSIFIKLLETENLKFLLLLLFTPTSKVKKD